jgi:TonB-dependent receptor
MALSVADATDVLGVNVGFLAAGTYSSNYQTEDLTERIIVTSAGDELPETDYTGRQTERTVRWSLFGKGNILLSPSNQLTVRSLYSRTGEDQSRNLTGFNRDRNTNLDNTRLRFISRSMWSNNVEGQHLLPGLSDSRINWRLGYSRATSDEPDRREMVYEQESDGRFAWRELTNSALRYFTSLEDTDRSAALDLTFPIGEYGSYVLKIGGLALEKNRDFFTRRFRFRARGGIGDERFLPADQLFSAPNIRPDFLELEEDTRRTDNYDGSQSTRAAYAMAEFPLTNTIRISGGARIENVRQVVVPLDLFDLGLPPLDSAFIDDTDILPAVNLTWSPNDYHNVRFGFSRTVARPQFREQAPFDFVDFAGGYLQVGNPALQRSRVFNYDLRWEWFPDAGALFAVSTFYKRFRDPIEAVVFPSSELISTWDNNESADLYGAEFEIRTRLTALGGLFENLALGGNLSLVSSEVQSKDALQLGGGASIAIEPRERALQGQSPYVVNVSVSYFSPGGGTSVTALYNRFGQRIEQVGTQVLPDVFENPVDQLDLVVRHDLGFAGMKLTATNLLDSDTSYEQAGQIVRRANRGRSVSVGFSIGS